MNALQAIPTYYRGVTTRSRLEARWLVCFDALRIAWEYEAQAFSLSDRGYLPDVWLPTQETWCEIKPPHTPLDHQLAAAVQEESGSPLLWIAGEPRSGGYTISLCDFGTVEVIEGFEFAVTRAGSLILYHAAARCRMMLPPSWVAYETEWSTPLDTARLAAAYQRATAWRF